MTPQSVWQLVAYISLLGGAALAQESRWGDIKPFTAVKFARDSDVKCLQSGLEAGDPTKGSSTFILKAPPGCVVPWHYHTAQEQLIIIDGTVLAEMIDHLPTRLGPGGFAVMGGRMAHQFTCNGKAACVMFVTFDRAYDIFWGKGD
jgi:quercetin dioxygenase-like cupin family protein